jgi:hypothetical protein
VIFSGDITLRILLINPFKDHVAAVFSQQDALFFSAPHQSLTVRRQNEKRALHAKNISLSAFAMLMIVRSALW